MYRALLRLYPRRFRDRYATEMIRAFDDRRRAAVRAGAGALARFYLVAVRDVFVNAMGERAGRPGPGPRDPGTASLVGSIGLDVRFAARMLRRRPALSFFTAATFALAIGAVTAVMSVIDAVVVQPLPFPNADRIVAIRGVEEGRPAGMSLENLSDLRRASRTLAAVTPFFPQSVNLTGVAEPDRVRGAFVTSDFFTVVAVPPALGQPFGAEADIPNSPRVVVLTDGVWQRRFGGSRDLIGRQLMLNNAPFTVVGVMPSSFDFPIDDADVFMPAWTSATGVDRGNHNFFGIGRLADNASVRQASAEAAAIAADLERAYPAANAGRGAIVEPLQRVLTEDATSPLALLLVMVGIMLLAACGNVAGLELGATSSRWREIAVRAALGAGRARIARQLIVESLLRAGIGSAFGIAAAVVAVKLVVAHAPVDVYGIEHAAVRPAVFAVAALATLLAGIAAGLPSVWHWGRGASLHGERTAGDAAVSRLRGALVVAQVALAAMLLVAAALTTRSFARLTAVDPGFDARNLLTMEYRLPRNKYSSVASQSAFHNDVLERVRALPGVAGAAGIRALPFSGNGSSATFRLAANAEPREAMLNATTGAYFETLRIPLLAGRLFDAGDRDRPVIVVSRAFSERHWPDGNVVGRDIRFDGVDIIATVVGVVGDVHHQSLTARDAGTIYTLQQQNPGVFNTLVVRTSGDPMALADAVRRSVWNVDPDQPVWKIRTVASLIDRSIATRRFLLLLVGFFGISAAILAVLGLYGVVTAGVSQRTREIGVRLALGATRASVLALVLRDGVRLGAAGIAVGLAGALAAANLLESFLFGITPRDPATYAVAAGVLMASALLACWLPGRRALRVDPAISLRDA
jgi:putative ABC transport system permease protein